MRQSRHIVSTTVTTFGAFLPLILEGGGFWPPLAITIAGGVVGATLLALVFVPSAYALVNRVRKTVPQAEQADINEPIEARSVVPELATA